MSIGNSMNNDNLTQLEFYHDRLEFTQRYAQVLKFNLMKISHKTSKVRDIGDESAQSLLDYSMRDLSASKEYSSLFNSNLKQFAHCLLAVEDHRDSNIECINSKVLYDLNQYIEGVKYTKQKELKQLFDTFNKTQPKKKGLINVLNMKTAKPIISDKDSSIKRHQDLSSQINKDLESFERKRIEIMQDILRKYTLSQINFHNQALQLYKNAYECLINQDRSYDIKNNICEIGRNLYSSDLEVNLKTLIPNSKTTNKSKQSVPRRNQNIAKRTNSDNSKRSKEVSHDSNYGSSTSIINNSSGSTFIVSPINRHLVNNANIYRSNSTTADFSSHSMEKLNDEKIRSEMGKSRDKIIKSRIKQSFAIQEETKTRKKILSGKVCYSETRI